MPSSADPNPAPPTPPTMHMIRAIAGGHHPVWRAKTLAWLALGDIALTAILVFVLGHRSIFARIEITLGIIAGTLFTFLALGLYRGVRVTKDKLDLVAAGKPWRERVPDLDFGWLGGCGSDLGSLILTLLVGLALASLAYFLLPAVAVMLGVLVTAIFWIFNRALRIVFIRSRTCRGRLAPSLAYALIYTVAYTGWLFLVTWALHRAWIGRVRPPKPEEGPERAACVVPASPAHTLRNPPPSPIAVARGCQA